MDDRFRVPDIALLVSSLFRRERKKKKRVNFNWSFEILFFCFNGGSGGLRSTVAPLKLH